MIFVCLSKVAPGVDSSSHSHHNLKGPRVPLLTVSTLVPRCFCSSCSSGAWLSSTPTAAVEISTSIGPIEQQKILALIIAGSAHRCQCKDMVVSPTYFKPLDKNDYCVVQRYLNAMLGKCTLSYLSVPQCVQELLSDLTFSVNAMRREGIMYPEGIRVILSRCGMGSYG